MKYSSVFKQRLGCDDSDEVFQYLMGTLRDTITSWEYFVNWTKVFDNIDTVEVSLNILNALIGKDNIEDRLSALLRQYPAIYCAIPLLVASRQRNFSILVAYDKGIFEYQDFNFGDFHRLNEEQIEKAIRFAKSTGFLSLLQEKRLKSVVDYVIGVEVGLDSNARKNRGGSIMEDIVESFVKKTCDSAGWEYLSQATASKIADAWKITLQVDKSQRIIDFAINNGTKLYLVETNFYGGGGSKLKSTAGEYKAMHDFWSRGGHQFVWITDGKGWKTTMRPLRETFEHIDYILNLDMLSKLLLDDIIRRNL